MISAEFSTIAGTQASEGRAGGHSVIADRPDGIAGGQGLGFNGGQLLALAIGGCLCNDLRYVADERGVELGDFDVRVDLSVVEGTVIGVTVIVDGGADRDAVESLLGRVRADSTIVNAVTAGTPVEVVLA